MEIEEIHNQTNGLCHINYDEETKVLTISSDFNPLIVDRNFNELEERIKELDTKINKILFNYTTL